MIFPSNKLTVIIRDDSPMVNSNDSPSYRSVQITLTEEQVKQLALLQTWTSGGKEYHEAISRCFIEPIP